MLFIPIAFIALCSLCGVSSQKTLLGVSTSAYQIEGAWNIDGRTESVWDRFSHIPGKIKDGSNGDVAADHYHHWEEDINLVEWLGAKVYRFSLSWTRILPTGRPDIINQKGVDFYNNIIDRLVSKNITPLATISHWDTPQSFQDEYGSWANDKMIDDFVNFADVCFQLFGDRVKYWLSLNEPASVVGLGYSGSAHAPGTPVANPYEVVHRMLLSHARTYHIYHDKYADQAGKLSVALNSDFVKPANPWNQEDVYAAQRGILWRMGLYADPLILGDYPKEIRDRAGGRLPQFKSEDKVKGTLDFFALNHYTTLEARPGYNQNYNFASDAQTSEKVLGKPTAASWLGIYPDGIYGIIKWLDDRYKLAENKMELMITESGVATYPSDGITDPLRIEYLDGYIKNALRARDDLGINLSTYCAWSMIDNFEWAAGNTENYGLISVDIGSNNRTRTLKDSAYWLFQSNLLE